MGINRPLWTTSLLMTGFGMTLILGGCLDSESTARQEAHEQIGNATRLMQTASLNEARGETLESDVKPLQDVISEVASSREKGTDTQKALFRALRSNAQLGIAEIHLSDASTGQREISRGTTVIHRLIDIAIDQSAMIDARRSFSYSSNLRNLSDQEKLITSRQQGLMRRREQLAARISDYESRIRQEMTLNHEINEEATRLRDLARNAPLDDREDMTRLAAARGRDADAHQVKAAQLEAELDLVQPQLVNAETELAKCRMELTNITKSRSAIQQREQALRAEIVTLEGQLQDTRGQINERYQMLVQAYTTEVAPSLEAAMNAAESARSDAERSARVSPAGYLRAAAAHQTIGRLHWQQTQTLSELSSVVTRSIANKNVLGEVAQQRVQLEGWQAEIKNAKNAASKAFNDAIEAANSESIRDNNVQMLRDEFVEDLEASIRLLGGTPGSSQKTSGDDG